MFFFAHLVWLHLEYLQSRSFSNTLKLKPEKSIKSSFLKTTFVFLALLIFNLLKSQDIQILAIDSSQYPAIKLKIAYKGKSRFDSDQLILKQNEKNLPFSIHESSPGSAPEKGRAIYYLVEASGNTVGKSLLNIKEGIIESFENLDPKDLVNLGWFSSFDFDSSNVRVLNNEFSTDYKNVSSFIRNKVNAKRDSMHFSDLNQNILSGIDYLSKQTELPKNKLFIVLSVDRDNSITHKINSSECISKSREFGIPIYSITYLANDSAYSSGRIARISNKTGGKNFEARSQIEIINALTDFYNAPVPASIDESYYDIEFTSNVDLNTSKAKIDINFNGNRQILVISDPNTDSLIPHNYKKYLWYSIAILGIVVMIMLLFNLFSRKGKQTNEEMESSIDHEEIKGNEKKNTYTRPTTMLTEEKISAPIISKPAGPSVLLSLQGRTHPFVISKNETSIGRHDSNDIPIPEQTVTGKHAKIVMADGKLTLVDLGSTNGTFVNGVRIRSHELKSGDRFRLGNVEMTLK